MNRIVLYLSVSALLLSQVGWGAQGESTTQAQRPRKPKVVFVKFDQPSVSHTNASCIETLSAFSRMNARRVSAIEGDAIEAASN